jgi:hypothetical protein
MMSPYAMSTNLKRKPHDKPAPYNQPVSRPRPDQLLSAEAEFMQSVNDLKARNRIFGELQTVDEILDPAEEIYGGILNV